MQFIFVHKTQSLPKWVDLLNKLGNGEAEIVECKEIQDFNASYNPKAVFYEFYLGCEDLLRVLKEHFPCIPFFSFATKPELKETFSQSKSTFHLEGDVTIKELSLHLFYGNQVNQLEDSYLCQKKLVINEITKLHLSLDKQLVLQSFVKTLPQIINLGSLAIFLISEDRKFLELANSFNVKQPNTLVKLTGQQSNSLIAKVVKSGKSLLVNKGNKDFDSEQ